MKKLNWLKFLIVTAFLIGNCQLFSSKSYALSNLWPDADGRVDGSVDTMDEVDTFINTLSLDIHERILSTDGETVKVQTDWTAAGKTCADLGTVMTCNIDGGTIDGVKGVLPSGAIYFMITGSCPTGTTDVSATYSDKFVRINATPASTGGADTHTHGVGSYNVNVDTTAQDYISGTARGAFTSTGANPIAGTSAAGNNVPAYVTMKACQVN